MGLWVIVMMMWEKGEGREGGAFEFILPLELVG